MGGKQRPARDSSPRHIRGKWEAGGAFVCRHDVCVPTWEKGLCFDEHRYSEEGRRRRTVRKINRGQVTSKISRRVVYRQFLVRRQEISYQNFRFTVFAGLAQGSQGGTRLELNCTKTNFLKKELSLPAFFRQSDVPLIFFNLFVVCWVMCTHFLALDFDALMGFLPSQRGTSSRVEILFSLLFFCPEA